MALDPRPKTLASKRLLSLGRFVVVLMRENWRCVPRKWSTPWRVWSGTKDSHSFQQAVCLGFNDTSIWGQQLWYFGVQKRSFLRCKKCVCFWNPTSMQNGFEKLCKMPPKISENWIRKLVKIGTENIFTN